MICVLKDLVESKTMVITMLFILGVAYIGGIDNKSLNINVKNGINMVNQVN